MHCSQINNVHREAMCSKKTSCGALTAAGCVRASGSAGPRHPASAGLRPNMKRGHWQSQPRTQFERALLFDSQQKAESHVALGVTLRHPRKPGTLRRNMTEDGQAQLRTVL